jgi:hypothetical protein
LSKGKTKDDAREIVSVVAVVSVDHFSSRILLTPHGIHVSDMGGCIARLGDDTRAHTFSIHVPKWKPFGLCGDGDAQHIVQYRA